MAALTIYGQSQLRAFSICSEPSSVRVTTVPTPAAIRHTAPTPLGVENKGLTRTKYP